ncbi:MAG: hypothetical protein ABGY11_13685 [Candidatus Thioglobus sp.]|jgi:hypothetical protein
MKARILLLSLSLVFLSGCVREESPLWHMTSSDEEIDLHFKQVCLDYGYKSGTPDLNRCIRQEKKASSSEASNRMGQLGQQLQQMDQQRIDNHNRAVDRMNQNRNRNIYNNQGQYMGYWR